MPPLHLTRAALAAALSAALAGPALAGRGGHAGSPTFRPAGGFHGAFGGYPSGGPRGPRRLPPVAGVIHERAGARPYFSAYGHTDTGARFGGFARGGVPAYGRPAFARPYAAGYGHLGTGVGAFRRAEALGDGRRRFAARRVFVGGFGGAGGFDGLGYGAYGAPGLYGDAGVYGGRGTYAGQGTYGQPGTYGGAGTTATQGVYGGGVPYRSEVPLAVRFAEPPLGPSPYAPYSSDDRYAYAASEDVGPARRLTRPTAPRAGCACAPAPGPTFYRYGVGTAY